MRALKANKLAAVAAWRSLNRSWLRSKRGPAIGQSPSTKLRNDSGQIMLEYILLLTISVSVAIYLNKQLVSKDPDNAGVITSAWSQINSAIGADIAD